ncbi:hypothetical protein K488DRAFT_40625 [Vararia minispora EC-137]|uniref:Uncharacterized protein n=1 Tax=Vararia minispora EC-137 TaxID=1314806 RepID=A0ACB8QXX4_9AGAM|nr:hypothetical protein K488DRAFT_40625 [Vararia minispora EC-137]
MIYLPFSSTLAMGTLAVNIVGEIKWNEHCGDYSTLGQAKVIIDDGFASGSVLKDGRFSIPDVEPGTYVLSVVAHDHKFDQVRVDVPKELAADPEIRPYTPGTPLNPPSSVLLPYPIKLIPRVANSYYVPPESFNLLAMFQNPMMLMMVAGAVMMFGLPYITKNLDPELMAEIQQNQARMSSLQNSLQSGDLKSGYIYFSSWCACCSLMIPVAWRR